MRRLSYELRYTYDPKVRIEEGEVHSRHDTVEEAVQADKDTGDSLTPWRAILAIEDGQPRPLTDQQEAAAQAFAKSIGWRPGE